jgi:hypothetical protein
MRDLRKRGDTLMGEASRQPIPFPRDCAYSLHDDSDTGDQNRVSDKSVGGVPVWIHPNEFADVPYK